MAREGEGRESASAGPSSGVSQQNEARSDQLGRLRRSEGPALETTALLRPLRRCQWQAGQLRPFWG